MNRQWALEHRQRLHVKPSSLNRTVRASPQRHDVAVYRGNLCFRGARMSRVRGLEHDAVQPSNLESDGVFLAPI